MNKRRKERRKSEGFSGDLVTGIPWYRPEQWARMRQVAADADKLEKTFEAWKKVATKTIRDLSEQGFRVHKIELDRDEFITWCKRNNKEADGPARARFVAEKLHELDSKGLL